MLHAGRVRAAFGLAEADRAMLEAWLRAPTVTQELALRTRVILARAAGEGVRPLAPRLGVSPNTAAVWRRRYRSAGLDSLRTKPRAGRPRRHPQTSGGQTVPGRPSAFPSALHSHQRLVANLVERWFALITYQAIRRGSFNRTQRLEQAIMRWLAHWNQNAQPFRWTEPAAHVKRSLANVTAVYET